MKYHCLHIQTDFAEEWQKDVFEQQLFDLGVDTIDGNDYYIPSDTWLSNEQGINDLCASTDGVQLLEVEKCPDENWNAAWEAEHPVQKLLLGIRIVPHCAFGAGYHETTSMMIDQLIRFKQHFAKGHYTVVDHGTGTGVLAIFAKRLGAAHVLAIDIDEKSVENAKENAELNGEDIEVRLGDTVPAGHYDLILANIHRNILIAIMPAYGACLNPNGELWISGFYESDIPALQTAAEKEGLMVTEVLANGEWRLMKCQNKGRR